MPRAIAPWALDSGGFTELTRHGRWTVTPTEYAAAVERYQAEIGYLAFAVQQDWMCTQRARARTGLSVREHQLRTITAFRALQDAAPHAPWAPAVHGWSADDYERHVDLFSQAGIDLSDERIVCVGSLAERQGSGDAAEVVRRLAALGISLHVLGAHSGIATYGAVIASFDTMAWSARARYRRDRLPTCRHRATTCSYCLDYALRWADRSAFRSPL